MKATKNLFGYATILFGLGFLVRSFMPAYAFNGPTVSMGSNPIKNFYGVNRIYAGNSEIIFTNTSSSDFIITQTRQNNGQSCAFAIDNQTILSHWSTNLGDDNVTDYQTFNGTLVLPSGSTLSHSYIAASGDRDCVYYVEGYYTH